jgi:spermidine/putrescine-binding protein
MDSVFADYKKLKPNVLGLLNDTQITNFLISGEAHVALAISGDGIAAAKEGADIGYAVPKEGMVLDRDFYLVFKGTPPEVQYYANVFANHVYDAATQTKLADTLGVVPAAPKATLPDYMKKDPLIYPFTPEQIGGNIILPIPLAAKHAEDWQASYEEALK